MASVQAALHQGVEQLRTAGSESARLDAELLLAHVLGTDRTTILAHPEAGVGEGQMRSYEEALRRRSAGEPVAYLRGVKEFFGMAFTVDQRALIPRPETERLVELGLERCIAMLTAAPRPADSSPVQVLDVGTGSGAVAVALAAALRRRGFHDTVRFLATDSSAPALALATENAVGHGVADVIRFREADVQAEDLVDGPYDLVLANLPYVPSDLVPQLPVVASFEPSVALDGGADGLVLIRALMEQLPGLLAGRGCGLLEIGSDQRHAVAQAADELLPGWEVSVHDDLASLPRVAELRPPRPDDRPVR